MTLYNRRSSLLNIDNWLDKCTNDEPDSMIFDPDYANESATIRAQAKVPEMEHLFKIVIDRCTKIGLSPEILEERLGDIDDCLTTYVKTLVKDVDDEYDKLCQYKQELLNQIQKMLKDLYLPAYQPDETPTFLQQCKKLKRKFTELSVVKEKRMLRLTELRDRQAKYCMILGIKAPQIKLQTDIPTEEELIKLASAITELEKEEKRRREKYALLKTMIKKCIDELEYESTNEFEQNVLNDNPDYTESYLLQMSDFHAKLEQQYAKDQEKFEKLRSRLISLYNRLDVDESERQKFLDEHNTCKPSLMISMECEIERYEELKRQNIGKFIEKIRDELVIEYDRCFITIEEQDNFLSLNNVSEELLELYEKELERVKKFYEDNSIILEKIQKWREMWKELIDLELKANDPNRFNNRGGQLLIEERKRKTLQKGIPKVERELENLNDEFLKRNGQKFKIFGSNIDEFISDCWQELNNTKEEQKRERLRAKQGPDTTKTMRRPGQPQPVPKKTPTKRVANTGVAATPSKMSCQRSILGTPANSAHRLNHITSGSVHKSAHKPPVSNYPVTRGGRKISDGKSNIPVSSNTHNTTTHKEKPVTHSNGSDMSALSVSEQEFVDLIAICPTSAKRER